MSVNKCVMPLEDTLTFQKLSCQMSRKSFVSLCKMKPIKRGLKSIFLNFLWGLSLPLSQI